MAYLCGSVLPGHRSCYDFCPVATACTRCYGRLQTEPSEEIYEKTEKVVAELKDKWDKTEEKPALIGLVTASIVLLYVLNGIVSAIDKIPVVSGLFELIGIFVSSWFVYRYLVFGPGTISRVRLDLYLTSTHVQCFKERCACRSPGAEAKYPGFLQEGTRQGLKIRP